MPSTIFVTTRNSIARFLVLDEYDLKPEGLLLTTGITNNKGANLGSWKTATAAASY